MFPEFDGVIFSRPGESGIISYLGALWAAEEEKSINSCKVWVSPSTTSLIAVMKILDYSCLDILALLTKIPQLATSPTPFKNPLNLGTEITKIKEDISEKILSKLGLIPNLNELYQLKNVVLVGIGFSLSRQEIEYIHKETYPNISVLDLICISLSTPGIYKPYKIGNDLWIDGSVIESFSPASIELNSGRILAITNKPTKIIYQNKDPINQVKDILRTVFENITDVAILDKYSNMTILRILSGENDSSIQLKNGWDSFINTVKDETQTLYSCNRDAGLQS